MSDNTNFFDVQFSVPSTSARAAPTFAQDDDAVLRIAAPGQPPIANQLGLTLTVDPLGTPPLSGNSPTLIVLPLDGWVAPLDARNIALHSAVGDWSLTLKTASATIELRCPAALTGATATVTLDNIVASNVAAPQPNVTLNGQPATAQNLLRAIQEAPAGSQALPFEVTMQTIPALIPIAPDGDVQKQTLSIFFDAGEEQFAVDALVTIWFDTQNDGVPPRRGDLGCHTDVVSRFQVQVGESYGNAWSAATDLAAQPPLWTFQSGGGLLPQGKAEVLVNGCLGTDTPSGPNLQGTTNCYVQVTNANGYIPRTWLFQLEKTIPLQSVNLDLGQAAIFRQSRSTFAVDTSGPATTFSGSVAVAAGEGVVNLSFVLPGQEPSELPPSLPIPLTGFDLATPMAFVLTAISENGNVLEECHVTAFGVDLAPGVDLRHLVFQDADLRHRKLGHCKANGVDFSGAQLDKTEFDMADLRGASFIRTTLSGTRFNGAQLQSADFRWADATGADFTDAVLDMVQWQDTLNLDKAIGVPMKSLMVWKIVSRGAASAGSLLNADLSASQLSAASFVAADLTGANLSGSTISNADFTDAVVENVTVDGASLDGAVFDRARLKGTALNKALVAPPKWVTVSLLLNLGPGAIDDKNPAQLDFSDANLCNADLSNLNFVGTNFQRSLLTATNMTGCILTEANFGEADLGACTLNIAQMAGANLTDANVKFADFRGALGVDHALGLAPKWVAVWQVVNGPTRITPQQLNPLAAYFPFEPPIGVTRADWSGQDFSDAQLAGAALYSCNLASCNFERSQLGSADLASSFVDGARFLGAQLDAETFEWVDLTKSVDLDKAVNPAKWLTIRKLQAGEKLSATALQNADLSFANLRKCDLRGLNFNGSNFEDADLRGSQIVGCDLSNTTLRGCQLAGSDLSTVKSIAGADFDFVPWVGVLNVDKAPGISTDAVNFWRMVNAPLQQNVRTERVNFQGVDWRGAQLVGPGFMGCVFTNADLSNTVFSSMSVFCGCCMDGVDLTGANLRAVNFGATSMEHAKFQGANLSTVVFGRLADGSSMVYMQGATYDVQTKWPPGFDPVQAGALLVPDDLTHRNP